MKPATVYLVDDDKNLLRVMSYHIKETGVNVVPFSSPLEAIDRIKEDPPNLVITDLRMPELDGMELLKRIRALKSEIPVIVLTAHGSIDKAVEAVKNGAFDFLSKPFEKEEIQHSIGRALKMVDLLEENRRLAKAVEQKFEFSGIAGSSKPFQEVIEMANQLAAVDTTVLIQGESGTGKELLARAIHFNSQRRNRPLVVVNCGAIPADLMESELFGYRKGAFTGAVANKKGKFETADSGTLFLDEVGELPLNMQVKLLRVLQQREVDIVGDPHPHPVDVRILAATNRDLHEMMQGGTFREDLYYRLTVAPLHIPPLRERREDIPLLAYHLLEKLRGRMGKEVTLDERTVDVLQQYDWPGNVRELENILERLAVFNKSGVIVPDDLPAGFFKKPDTSGNVRIELPEEGFSLEELERDILLSSLRRNDWNQTQTARYLGITRNTLIYRMQKFDLKKDDN